MNASKLKSDVALWALGYLATLKLALYLSRGLGTLHPSYWLVLVYAALGLLLSLGLRALVKPAETGWVSAAPFGVFALMQGGVGYAVARYAFNLGAMESLAYPVGGAVAMFGFLLLYRGSPGALAGWVATALYAGGLTLALRLGGIQGGLFFGIALLNAYFLGKRALGAELGKQWGLILGYAGLLVVGRAALQVYLVESGYAELGIVVGSTYTFVALFIGLALPWFFSEMEKEKCLPIAVSLVLLGILLPAALGVFIHVRPMGAYLMGLLFSGFVVGIVYWPSAKLASIVYLNLIVVNVAVPWHRKLASLTRWERLEILAALAVLLMAIAFLAIRRRDRVAA